jgi:2-haloacid dehalogenase
MSFDTFDVLTFDCYGTLIDWESGIIAALRPILIRHDVIVEDEEILALFGEIESSLENEGYRPYRKILEGVVDGFGEHFSFKPLKSERELLTESIKEWPPFTDTVESLRALKNRYRLAVISNIDDDLFAHSAKKLGVEFDGVVTAQQVSSYKPSLKNFFAAFERLKCGPEEVLHVAQSIYHDICPAREIGLSCVWVNRRKNQVGSGATAMATAEPNLEVPDLKTLTLLMGLG